MVFLDDSPLDEAQFKGSAPDFSPCQGAQTVRITESKNSILGCPQYPAAERPPGPQDAEMTG